MHTHESMFLIQCAIDVHHFDVSIFSMTYGCMSSVLGPLRVDSPRLQAQRHGAEGHEGGCGAAETSAWGRHGSAGRQWLVGDAHEITSSLLGNSW